MTVQECIFVAGSIIFILALLPSVFGEDKPDRATSAMTGTVLAVFGGAYVSMDFYFAAITSFITAALWGTMWWQKRGQDDSA